MESEQFNWLENELKDHKPKWHIIGNPSPLAPIHFPAAILGGPPRSLTVIDADQWDGYQARSTTFI